MKKLLIVLFSLGLALGASAQKYAGRPPIRGGIYYRSIPRVAFGFGAFGSPFNGFYGNPFYYRPFYDPFYSQPTPPSKLDIEIEEIRNEYAQKIWDAKNDESLPRKERKRKAQELKLERDQTITEAKKNYYRY
ncbi:MAG: hypothetical protein H7Y03_09270 [Chitinophagaceae bacterium]|nr:hypothetical protein [Chitinophagaceae bacterium]